MSDALVIFNTCSFIIILMCSWFAVLDINECAVNNGKCEQNCYNNIGSYWCSCQNGYILESNGLNCSGI